MARHDEVFNIVVAQGQDRADNFGNDVAGLPQYHGVTNFDVFRFDDVFVVQGGHRDGRTIHKHRLHDRIGCHTTGAPHVDSNIEQFGVYFFRRILKGYGPAWGARGETELLLVGHMVDFDHNAVNLMHKVMATLAIFFDVVDDLLGDFIGRTGDEFVVG